MKKHWGFFGDGVGLKIGFFLGGFYPRKFWKIILGYFGEGVGLKIGFFWGFYPGKSPKIIWGYFRVSSPTNPEIDYYNSCFPQKSRVEIAIAPLALLQQCPWIRSKGNHVDIDGSSVGKRVPIPIYPRPHPGFLGKEQGQG